jgi:putative membrane-bound dehydrogenase-like protein
MPCLILSLLLLTAPDELTLEGRPFTLPPGFTLEIAAAPPLVERPITAAFDEKGRLYVAESSGTNDKVEIQLEQKPHSIIRLEDTDNDGRFDRRTTFADKMMFPEGTLWHAGSLYVAAPPHIWKLTDTNDDGVADTREIWLDAKTLTGCANDLHGPYLGPDGYIYWCKGAFAEQTYERPGKEPFVTRASHIFRRRADGTGPIEPVMTGGMDNPVDVVFMPNGDRIFTTTFLVHPGGGQRDGLIHAIPGAIYGKVHDPIFSPVHKWTHPETMPPLVHLGPAVPAGLARYESNVFDDYTGNLFACLFNLHKITRHVLTPSGSTYTATTEDFLTSPDIDFHPTDVVEAPDGSLLVVNTGGWYKLCCPTSQLHKPDVLGTIYRIRKRDVRVDLPPSNDGFVHRLSHPSPTVRRQMTEYFLGLGPAAIAKIASQQVLGSPEGRAGAVWIASRIDSPAARAFVRKTLDDPGEVVHQAALSAISLHPDPEALPQIRRLLASGSMTTQRFAAEALGRIGDSAAVPDLLAAASQPADRPLQHAITYALIQIGDTSAIRAGLAGESPATRRAALVALDQLGDTTLDPQSVAALSLDTGTGDADLREAAAWILTRHPEWGDSLAGFFAQQLAAAHEKESVRARLADQLAPLSRAPGIERLLANTLASTTAPSTTRAIALHAMQRSPLARAPESWTLALVIALDTPDAPLRADTIAAIRALRFEERDRALLETHLTKLGRDEKLDDGTRLAALVAIPGGLESLDPALVEFLLDRVADNQPIPTRLAAADVLARARLGINELIRLTHSLPTTGPLELARILPAFERNGDVANASVGRALLAELEKSPAASSIPPDTLRAILKNYPDIIKHESEKLLDSWKLSDAHQHEKLEALLKDLPSGEIRRGQSVFMGQKAACSSCHAIGYLGGKIGPDLTKIGEIRTERDLLESIIAPSASFVRSYEPMTVATTDGRVLSGLVKKDAPDELVLTIAADQEARVPRGEVEEIRPATVSVMPAGLDQQLTPQELADLVAFLKACK